jgi:transcriptional regulator with XRE-family HTH domain
MKKNDDVKEILTLPEVAERLRCSRAHVSKLLNGRVPGLPALTHMAMGRRKVVRREWLEVWLNVGKTQC